MTCKCGHKIKTLDDIKLISSASILYDINIDANGVIYYEEKDCIEEGDIEYVCSNCLTPIEKNNETKDMEKFLEDLGGGKYDIR